MKKLVVFLLVLTLSFSMLTVAFTEETAKTAAEICEELGILTGTGDGVTEEYLATTPERYQAAIMFLRLKGLYVKAVQYKGKKNFPDAGELWDEGQNMLAYLNAHPELGWVGSEGKFLPRQKMTARAYYKVMLEALGYRQNTADQVGDFEWSEVFTFAAEVGLTKLADVEGFTINDLAVATVEALRATTSNEKTTLAEQLVERGVIDEELAVKLGIVISEEEKTRIAAVKAAEEAIAAIPSIVTLDDEDTVAIARVLVDYALQVGATNISGLYILLAAEYQISELKAAASTYDIKSAVALNSRIVQVELGTAASVIYPNFIVKDSSNNTIAVTGAQLAEWDDSGKTLLVTLNSSLSAGSLYTITSGSKSANFGGKGADTTKPEIDDIVKAIDYNEIEISFTEAIKLSTLDITIRETYNRQSELFVYSMKYSDRNTIILTTADQKSGTLYDIIIEHAEDLSGNIIKEASVAFAGRSKPTDQLSIVNAIALDYNKLYIEFNVNVDLDMIPQATFTIRDKYITKTIIPGAARAATTTESDEYLGGASTSSEKLAAVKKAVVVDLLGELKSSTLYEVEIANLKTLYGVALSSTGSSKTFVGKSKPNTSFTYTLASPVPSNTTLQLTFANKVTEEAAENTANYSITEAYFDRTPLPVYGAELQSDGKTVKLTVASMKNALYRITITNITDIYGNRIKTDNNANTATFVGATVSPKISSIVNIERRSDTVIRLEFDQPVGYNATDVANYMINNNIGYPEKVTLVTGSPKKVDLTIPKTTAGKIYKLTVKNLVNADGVAMAYGDTIEKTFAGQGISTTKAVVLAVVALDNQTIEILFDRSVMDPTIAGKIWSGTAAKNNLINNALIISNNGDKANKWFDLEDAAEYAYQDPKIDYGLIVRVNDDDKFKSSRLSGANTFLLIADAAKVYSSGDANVLPFAYSDDEPSNPRIEGVFALNSTTLRVYFSEPVAIQDVRKILVYNNSNLSVQLAHGILYKTYDNVIFDIRMNNPVTSSNPYVAASIACLFIPDGDSAVTDISGTIDFSDGTSASGQTLEYGVNDTAADASKITDVYAIMPDKRTIEVYFPEEMGASAAAINNYFIVSNADGSSAPAQIFAAAGAHTLSADGFKATLYLTADISSLSLGRYYLAVDSDVANILETNTVKSEKTAITPAAGFNMNSGLVVQFAPGTAAVAEPEIESAAASDDRMQLKITFSEPVLFPAAADINARSWNSASASLTPAELLSAMKLTAQFEGEASAAAVGTEDITSVAFASNKKAVTITFKVKLAANSSGTVTTKGASADRIINKKSVYALVSSSGSEISFAVAESLFSDVLSPIIVDAVLAEDSGSNDNSFNGVGDTMILVFSERIALNISDADGGLSGTQISEANLEEITGWSSGTIDYDGASRVTAVVNANKIILTISGNALDDGVPADSTVAVPGSSTNLVRDTAGNNLGVNGTPALLCE
ncbi:MAG: hypothetical protein ACOZCL_11760 [Bacillota bacterium]